MTSAYEKAAANAAVLSRYQQGCRRFDTHCGDGVLVWRTWGEGRPVLLLHGGHGSWTHWLRNLSTLLESGHSVWAPDLPGMGESALPPDPWTPESLADILEAGLVRLLPGQAVDVVGFSFGGMLGGHLAARFPERVARLLLVGAAAMGMTSDEHIIMRNWRSVDDPVQRRAIHRHNLLAHMMFDPAKADSFVVGLQQINVENDRLRNRMVSRGDTLFQALKGVRCPIHGIWGANDELYRMGRDRLSAAMQEIGAASMQFVEHCGHWVAYEQAEQFNAALLEILGTSSAAASQLAPPRPLPLLGITVIELGASVAAPFAAQILGDLGARVVKVEKNDGDDARKWGPPFWDGASATFQSVNRGKQSVQVDMRDPAQRTALTDYIIEHADVVLQNMRPGQVETLGLDATSLQARKPALVYCNIGAFGSPGPLASAPGYDPLMQAFGGLMSVTGEEGRQSVRVGSSVMDMGTAMWAVIGIVSALYQRRGELDGRGRTIDVSLFETATSWLTVPAAHYLASGEVPKRMGSGMVGIAPYRAFKTSDGEIVIAAGNNALFAGVCSVVGHMEWLDDARFATNPDRYENAATLSALLETILASQPTAHWQAGLDATGVPCAPVQNVAQVLDHPHFKAMGILQKLPDSELSVIGLPIRFDGLRPVPTQRPPKAGEHSGLLHAQPAHMHPLHSHPNHGGKA